MTKDRETERQKDRKTEIQTDKTNICDLSTASSMIYDLKRSVDLRRLFDLGAKFFNFAKMGKHSQQTSGVLWHLTHTDMESRKIAEIMGQC